MNLPFGLLLLIASGIPVIVVLGALAVLTFSQTRRTAMHPGALAARWSALGAGSIVTIVLLIIALSGAFDGTRLGLGALAPAAPLLGASLACLILVVGERTLPEPPGRVRRAWVGGRSLSRLAPLPVLAIPGIMLASALAFGTAATLLGSADDQGRPGRSLMWTEVLSRDPHLGTSTHTMSPFPGSWYTVPALLALLLLLLTAGIAIAMVLRRRPSSDAFDVLVRRRSAVSVLGAVTAGTAMSTGGLVLFSAPIVLAAAGSSTSVGVLASLAALAGVLSWAALPVGLWMVCLPSTFARDLRPPRRQPAGAVAADPIESQEVR